MQENSILLYGLSNIKYAIFQQLFEFDYIGSDYRIIRCDNSFEKLLKQPCACIVLAPSKLTSEQAAALNERYKNEERILFLTTEKNSSSLQFPMKYVRPSLEEFKRDCLSGGVLSALAYPCGYQCDDIKPEDRFVVVDVESTGLHPVDSEIISIKAVRIENRAIVDHFESLVRPKFPIEPFVEELTEITNQMVADAPPIADALDCFLKWAGDAVFIEEKASGNVWNFLKNACLWTGHEWKSRRVIRLLQMVKMLHPTYVAIHSQTCARNIYRMLSLVGNQDLQHIDFLASVFISSLEDIKEGEQLPWVVPEWFQGPSF